MTGAAALLEPPDLAAPPEHDPAVHLSASASSALIASEAALDTLVAKIDTARPLIGRGCGPSTISRLNALKRRAPEIWQVQLLDATGAVYCDAFGPPRRFSRLKPFAARFGEHLFLSRSADWLTKSDMLVFSATAGGRAALAVSVDPKYLKPKPLLGANGGLQRLTVRLAGYVELIAATDAPPYALGTLRATAASMRYPLQVTAIGLPTPRPPSPSRTPYEPPYMAGFLIGLAIAFAGLVFAQRRKDPVTDIKTGLARGEFRTLYQPIVSLKTGGVAGVEVLMRWHHPRRGVVSPDSFIPVAEETGLIRELTRWLVAHALSELRPILRAQGDFYCAINIAAHDFVDPEFLAELDALAHGKVARQRLLLEVTERQILDDSDGAAARSFKALRDLGFRIAIDDFGTGHNGLAMLERHQVDVVKIDKTFVDALAHGAEGRPVLDAMIDMAEKLEIAVVAEGVETISQLDYLCRRGVDYGQGYYFARPLPIAELKSFVADFQLYGRVSDEPETRPSRARHRARTRKAS